MAQCPLNTFLSHFQRGNKSSLKFFSEFINFRYKDNFVISDDEEDYRISIRNKPTGTKLIIRELLTSDSGKYRCEASNGVMRIVSTAKLKVSFSKLW